MINLRDALDEIYEAAKSSIYSLQDNLNNLLEGFTKIVVFLFLQTLVIMLKVVNILFWIV